MRLPEDPVEWVLTLYIGANLLLLVWLVAMVVFTFVFLG
jgi:hypothetical protein